MAAPKAVILLAAERSGTHLLRSIVNSSGSAFAPGEPANAGAERGLETSPTDFFRIRHEYVGSREGVWIPTVSAANDLLTHFFRVCEGVSTDGKIFVCDVKYAHIHNFNAGWWDFFSVPTLINFAFENGIPIIHLIRRTPAETIISGMYAVETGVWRAWSQDGVKEIQIHVPRQVLIAATNRLVQTIYQFTSWMKNIPHVEMYYDELLSESSMSWSNWQRITGREISRISPKVLKTTPEYKKSIKNYEEIKDLIPETIFEWRKKYAVD